MGYHVFCFWVFFFFPQKDIQSYLKHFWKGGRVYKKLKTTLGNGLGEQMLTHPNQMLTFHFISFCSIRPTLTNSIIILIKRNFWCELCFANTAQDKALYISLYLHCQVPRTLIRLLEFPSLPSH